MSVINILSPHVADLIAAGEVVERPASVIKELVENAFDAGAKNVTVEIRNGGSSYIRVVDDGCGMSPEDAGLAFLRHATSKLADERGLESIGTMGFRGEALAAISSVSHVSLRTRRPEDAEGVEVLLTGGEMDSMDMVGCPAGTTIIIKDLFFNTPARRKFLKTDRSESTACQQAAVRCALSRPDVAFRFLRDGEEVFFSPGNGKLDSCVYAVLGRDAALGMLSCDGENEGMTLSGLISSPSSCRGNRGGQYFFCNGRFIHSLVMQTALEQAYKNSLLTGRYPACVLCLSLPLGNVDVNVHPAKTEVKFSDEKKVFDLVYYSVLAALDGERRTATAASSPSLKTALSGDKAPSRPAATGAAPSASPAGGFYKSMSASEFRSSISKSPSGGRMLSSDPGYQTKLDLSAPALRPAPTATAPAAPAGGFRPQVPKVTPVSPDAQEIKAVDILVGKNVENSVQNVDSNPIPDHKISGEVFRKYIIVELEDRILLIDKHAAHERMIFDRLKASATAPMSQTLLLPVPVRTSQEDYEALTASTELLVGLGFEIDALDDGNLMVRSVPADMYAADIAPALEEIAASLRSGTAPDPASVRDEILHTVACKAAIKAGWNTSEAELETVAAAVLSGDVLYCPHGRPVSITVEQKDLDRLFKRIV